MELESVDVVTVVELDGAGTEDEPKQERIGVDTEIDLDGSDAETDIGIKGKGDEVHVELEGIDAGTAAVRSSSISLARSRARGAKVAAASSGFIPRFTDHF
jgi:hypothetical protein